MNFSSNKPINYTRLKDLFVQSYNQLNRTNNNKSDLLQFVDTSFPEVVVDELKIQFQQKSLQKIINNICNLTTSHQSGELNNIKRSVLLQAIKFIGKTYNFSDYLLTKQLFSPTHFSIANQIRTANLDKEYLQCLARVAINEELQTLYFNWFESNYKLENSQYLWGYGRILLWYYNFDAVNLVNYRTHFTAIMEYLLSKPYTSFNHQYKQNAFLSLLYLLTFRANDNLFCQRNSQEMRIAESVINHFSNDRIILNTVSREKPLNQFFQEMIAGTTTEDDLRNLVQG